MQILFKIYKIDFFHFAPVFLSSFAPDFQTSYDNVLCRLMVRPWDNWRGINPSGIDPDPPIFAAKFANVENFSHILAIANEEGRVSEHRALLSIEFPNDHFNITDCVTKYVRKKFYE